jgi:phosphoribosylaminoimidazolecarboxamide formyltransferase/IMP cyclohydrolase
MKKQIKNALISVYSKDNLESLVRYLNENGVNIYSTGGTSKFIQNLGIKVNEVEELTSYPSILGGRVKTLHPKVFGGILARREVKDDLKQLKKYKIPQFDLVVVDLYPFIETVESGGTFEEVIEKIDIGGISLIRATAKNFNDTVILCKQKNIDLFVHNKMIETNLQQRMELATTAFKVTKKYDKQISKWMQSNLIKEAVNS